MVLPARSEPTRRARLDRARPGWFIAVKMTAVVVLVAGGLSGIDGRGLRGAEPAPLAVEEGIVELPKFEVVDSRLLPQPEKWHYAEIPGFEILSSISERETKRFVRDFLLLQQVIDIIMPGLRGSQVAVPTSLVLTGRGKGFDRFMPVDRGDDVYRTNSLFFDDPERAAIVVDFALAELQLEDNTTIESDPYRGFYREYFRFMIRRQIGHRPPAWFEEGLVQLFASIDFTKKWINFAMVGDGFGGERTGDFNRMLAQRAIIPFRELFADPPTQRGTFWDAEAYAFVHMCLYGRGQRYQNPFLQFLKRLDTDPASEALFQECFKMDYKKMQLELRGYVDFTDHKYMQFTAKKGQSLPEPPPVTLRDATEAESGRIVGEVLRFGGHGDDAHLALIAPYVRGDRDPRLLAALGLDERLAGHDERAQKFLEAAAKAKVNRARAYLELAQLRYTAAEAKPGAGEKFSPAQVDAVLHPLDVARSQPPPMAAVYGLMAETWRKSAAAPSRAQFDLVLEGVKRFPRQPAVLLQAVLLAAERGFPQDAYALADRGTKIFRDVPAEHDRFQVLADALRRDATEAVAPVPPPPAAPARPDPFAK